MALDGLFLHCIGQELETAVIGAKVDKVYQPSSEELVLTLRSRDLGALKLLLCARANSPRIHLTKAAFENPATPPMLCMLLRKRLGGATLTGIRQAGFDRILFLDFSATNELGDKETLTVAMEIMAQYSNVILIGPDGKIIDALKRVDLTRSSKRLILPGLAYELPPQQDKLALPEHSVEELVGRIRSFSAKTLSSAVLSSIQGVSPALAREVAFRALGDDKHLSEMTDDDFVDLEYPLLELKKEVASPTHTFCVVRDDNDRPFEFSFWDLKQYGPGMATDHYETASELLDEYYAKRDSMERIAHKSSDLRRFLNTATERIARKVEVQRAELAKSVDREKLRVYAELINANLYQLEKGVLYYDLENYYDENRILRVPADPALSPAQNSQKYYKDYRKTYTAEKKLTEQIEQGTEELAYLETVKDALSRAETERDIGEIRRELVASGYLKDKTPEKKNRRGSQRRDGKKARSAKQPPALPPIEYETTDGFRVLVGRNNLQNDKLSMKQAGKLDMWLHTKDFPGSHVIIEAQDGEVSDRAIEEAAIIAAVNSTARTGDKVPVDYTLVKNLKKPAGARPGKVIFHTNWTIYVTPDEDFAEAHRKK
ncbi:MAG: fibronectin/fibrinogen-binding protein [Ruminococcaceae bacterium]|nr:fibronectin/fibrinogen-binding protein [Oscillospiraceae bacterium]